MKKLIDIINIQQLNEAYALQVDLKMTKKLLIRYKQSLNLLKARSQENYQVIAQVNKNILQMTEKQSKTKKKKTSQLDYFAYAGTNIFNCTHTSFEKIACFYGRLNKRVVSSQISISKYLSEMKKKESKEKQSFEKQVKSYAADCFPETTGLMFALGFTNPDKIQKKENSVKQQTLVQQARKYLDFLNQNLSEMEALKQEAEGLSREYFEGARDFWIGNFEQAMNKLQELQVNEEEVQKIGEETGAVTDRSTNSQNNKSCEEVEQYI